ncbi:MAG: DUF11 domain-containing protein [Deltaproteobacteria bacterium]|nr:DUF11 domain-containing protein [Deltaproteobacteria bacterium]
MANATTFINGAMVSWEDGQGNSYGPASSGLATTIYTVPNLLIAKTGPSLANPSDNCTYTITITNTSDAVSDNTTLVDYIPTRMSYVSSSPLGSVSGDNVTWNLGTIAGGASRTISITLMADPSLDQEEVATNVAVVGWRDGLDNEYGPASAIAQTRICPFPVLSIAVNGPATGEPCDTLTFRLRVTNTSATIPADNVTAQYILPSGSSYVSSSDGGAYANGMVVWNLGALVAGGSREVTVTITYCVIPVGSEIVSPAGVVWQCPSGIIRGPVFGTTRTRIVASPEPPPPPPPQPTPTPSHRQRDIDRAHFEKRKEGPAPLPTYSVTNLAVSSSGKGHQVSVNVSNNGEKAGVYTVYLKINSRIRDSATVTITPGSTKQVCWTLDDTKPGNYMVEVSSQRAALIVPDEGKQSRLVIAAVLGVLLWAFLVAGIIIALRRRAAH